MNGLSDCLLIGKSSHKAHGQSNNSAHKFFATEPAQAIEHITQARQLIYLVGRQQEARLYEFKHARFLLESGAPDAAASKIEPLLPYLPQAGQLYSDAGVEFPLETFAITDQIFAARGDSRRSMYLETAHLLLDQVANNFTSQSLRDTFLHAHPINRYLLDQQA